MEYRYPLKEEIVTMLHGSGAPDALLGANGSYYVDDDAHTIYGPKSGGSWGTPLSMVGPIGATGPQGTPGGQSVEYVTEPIEVDHGDVSPVALVTAPANCIVKPIIRCTETVSGVDWTLGDEDDPDSMCTNAIMPTSTSDAPVVSPLSPQYYASAKSLRATITTAGTSGKINVQFIVTLLA